MGICNSQISMQVTFIHEGAKKDGTLMIGQGLFGDLYDSIATTKQNLSKKYDIPVENMDITFGPTNTKWEESQSLSSVQVTVHRGVNIAFKGGDGLKFMENVDKHRFRAQ